MRRLFLTLALLLAFVAAQAQIAGENIDVTHYEINLWGVDFTNRTLQGEAFIDFTTTASLSTLVLELKTLTVTDVASDYYDVESFSQEGDFLTIVFDETIAANERVTLDVRYGGNTFSETWGGVEWWGTDYVYNLGVGFDSQPHNLGKTWFPCVDNFTDKATYSLYITVTNNKKAICGGNLVNVFDNGDNTSEWHWEIPQEVATYHPSFAIGEYMLWEEVYHGVERDIPVQVYVKPTQINSVPGTFVHIHDIAAFYEENFGPYPFNRIGYVCTGKGCMEHIDNIAITPGVIAGNTTQEEYLAHELSHMYFGNKTTCSTAGDMWLNEGFAQFCGLFYRVGVYGEEDFQTNMSALVKTMTSWCARESNWIPLNNMPLDMTYDSQAIYDRGAVIVNTMMNYMGRENFLAGLRHYLETYAYAAASSEQLCDALTESTGIDMHGFFDTYVFHGGMPHYGVAITGVNQNGSQYDTRIKLNYQHIGPSHVGQNNRVEVTFVDTDGQLHTQLIGWDGVEDEQVLTLDFEPEAAYADYYNHFLDAKYDQNAMATGPTTVGVDRLQVKVISASDSTLIRAESHLVAPADDPEILGLNLSTTHYWNIGRHDFGEAEVEGVFTYSYASGYDDDIINTENDSIVLLYRSNVSEPWHTIPFTREGNWMLGRLRASDVRTGQYALATIDKTIYSVNDTPQQTLKLFPNPATNQVTLQMDSNGSGVVNVYNQQLQLVKTESYTNTTKKTIDLSGLATGIYYIENNKNIHKLIINQP